MSNYLDWTPLSKTYDQFRPPIGVQLYLGLAYGVTGKTAEKIHLLDAGCGTGTHVEYLLNHGLARADMLDANEGMLQKAEERLKPFIQSGKVKIQQNILPEIPYEDETFDMVMLNQVVHHLTDENDKENTLIRKTLKEAFRVLKKPGILIVTNPTKFQAKNGFWHMKGGLFPETLAKFQFRFSSSQEWVDRFSEAGFQDNSALIEPLSGGHGSYRSPEAPLEDSFFLKTSVLASVGDEEKARARAKIRELKAEGKLEQFYKDANSMREHCGPSTIFYGAKR